jgi:hypothetical protein
MSEYDKNDFMRDLASAKLTRTGLGILAGGYTPQGVSAWATGRHRVPKWVQTWMKMFLRLRWAEDRLVAMENALKRAGFVVLDSADSENEDRPEPLSSEASRNAGANRPPPPSSPDQSH